MRNTLTIGFLLPISILEFSKTKRDVKVKGFRRGSKYIKPFRRKQLVGKKEENKTKTLALLGTGAALITIGGAAYVSLKGKNSSKLAVQKPIVFPNAVRLPQRPARSPVELARIIKSDLQPSSARKIDSVFNLSNADRVALDSYFGMGFKNINALARGKTTTLTPQGIEKYEAYSDILQDALLTKLPELKLDSVDHYLQRGTTLDINTIKRWQNNLGSEIFEDPGFISTSTKLVETTEQKLNAAKWYGGQSNNTPVYMRIRPDSRGSGEMQARYIGEFNDMLEQEALFPKGSSFIVENVIERKVKRNKNTETFFEVDLREIHPKFNK